MMQDDLARIQGGAQITNCVIRVAMAQALQLISGSVWGILGVIFGLLLCRSLVHYSYPLHPQSTNHGNAIVRCSNGLLLEESSAAVNVAAAGMKTTSVLAVAIILESCNADEVDSMLLTWGRDVPPYLITLYYTCCEQLQSSALALTLGVTHRHVSCNSTRRPPPLASVVSHLAKHNTSSSSSPQWYLIVSRYNYVNYDLLVKFLNQLDSRRPLYLGKPLNSDSMLPWRTFCARDHGIVISQALLQGLEINCSSVAQDASCLGESIWNSHHVRCWEKLSEAWSPFSTNSNITKSLKERNSLILYPMLNNQTMAAAYLTRKVAEYRKLLQKQRHTKCLMNQLQYHSALNHSNDSSTVEVCLRQHNNTVTSKNDVQSWEYHSILEAHHDERYLPASSSPPWVTLPADKRKYFRGNITYYARYTGEDGMTYYIDREVDDDLDELQRTILEVELDNFEENEDISVTDVSQQQQTAVHFVVSVRNGLDNVDRFLNMYEQIFLSTNQWTSMILVMFGKELYNGVSKLVKLVRLRYPKANFTTVRGEGEFSRSRAVNLGMCELDDDDLAFFCDIGVDITDTGFLDRCRRNTIKGERVYFPEIFRYYKIYRQEKQQPIGGLPPISRETGHWITYGYGMVCIYKQDHLAVGRMNECIEGWGGEDNDYYKKVKVNFDIFRAPDPSLRHKWHSKNCTAITTPAKLKTCQGSSSMVLGERRQLAMYLVETTNTTL